MTKKQKIAYYVLLVVVSGLFIFSAISKIIAVPAAVAGFTSIGLPMWFMYVIGLGELLGGMGLWIRPVFRYSSEGLFLVLLGAFGTTLVFMGPGMALFPLAVGVLLGLVVWLHKKI